MTARDQRRFEPDDAPHPPVNQRRRLWLRLTHPPTPLPTLCLPHLPPEGEKHSAQQGQGAAGLSGAVRGARRSRRPLKSQDTAPGPADAVRGPCRGE